MWHFGHTIGGVEVSVGCATPWRVQVGMLPKDMLTIQYEHRGLVRVLLSKPRSGWLEDAWSNHPDQRRDMLITFKPSDKKASIAVGHQSSRPFSVGSNWLTWHSLVRGHSDNATVHVLCTRLRHARNIGARRNLSTDQRLYPMNDQRAHIDGLRKIDWWGSICHLGCWLEWGWSMVGA